MSKGGIYADEQPQVYFWRINAQGSGKGEARLLEHALPKC